MKRIAVVLLVSLFGVASVHGEDLILKEQAKVSEKAPEGWNKSLKINMNFSISSSDQVIGQDDGDSTTIGGGFDYNHNYKKGQNEWRNQLVYSGKTSKTTALPRFVKSADNLKFETLYLYSLENYPRVGPYVRASAQAPAFFGESVQTTSQTFQIKDGGPVIGAGETQKLTDGFAPLTLSEAVGFFFKQIDRKNTKLEWRIGLGAQQIQAKDQLVVDDDAATTGIIELRELENTSQSGIESGVVWKGKWNKDSSYEFNAQFLTPLGTDIEDGEECDECETIELTNVDIKAVATTKLSSWANLSYEYKAVKTPQILNKFQITHGLVLNMQHELF